MRIEAADDADIRAAVSRAFAERDVALLQMVTSRASLEDVFVELTTETPEEVEAPC